MAAKANDREAIWKAFGCAWTLAAAGYGFVRNHCPFRKMNSRSKSEDATCHPHTVGTHLRPYVFPTGLFPTGLIMRFFDKKPASSKQKSLFDLTYLYTGCRVQTFVLVFPGELGTMA